MEIEEGGCPPTQTFFWSCRGILQRPRVEELLPGLLCLWSEWIIEPHLCLMPPTLLSTDLSASPWLLCLPRLHHALQFVCSLCVLVYLQPILVLQGGRRSQQLNIQAVMSTDGVTYSGLCDDPQCPVRFGEIKLQGNRYTGQCGGSGTTVGARA